MDIQAIISQLAVLFILLMLGYVCGKAKVLPPETGRILTKVVMNVTLPCTALTSVVGGDLVITGGETVFYMLAAALAFLIFFAIAIPSSRIMFRDKPSRGLSSYMIVFSNCGFMGFPVAYAIFGAESMYYVALFNIVFTLFVFTAGPVMMSGKSGKPDLKTIITPAFIASILVIPIALTGYKTPAVIADTIRLTGNVTTPASMLVIGITLSLVPVKAVFSEYRLYPIAVLKLVVIPLVVWLVLRQIVADDFALGMLVILSAMPTAAMAVIHAIELGNNERFASSGIFLTTLLSCATIPLTVYLILM